MAGETALPEDRDRVYAPFEGKYVLFELEANRAYKIVTTTGEKGGLPEDVDAAIYTDKNEALHAVFLKRVAALMEGGG